jgi:hypothetical protein
MPPPPGVKNIWGRIISGKICGREKSGSGRLFLKKTQNKMPLPIENISINQDPVKGRERKFNFQATPERAPRL